ncbi:hypothetical protein ACFSCX_24270 [Bacillus salitolerans]|uniref:Lipoprotein n=1 Tax=Bacillus salitolerans TaxID=1437434 RepID=A0ABW4LZE4_9BACI
MKRVFVFILFLILLGCSTIIRIEENDHYVKNKIVMEQLVGEEYKTTNVIKAESKVKLVMEALNATHWREDMRVLMMREEDYRFYLMPLHSKSKEESEVYRVWITPNKDRLQVLGFNQFAIMNEENSAIIHGVLTGENLGE